MSETFHRVGCKANEGGLCNCSEINRDLIAAYFKKAEAPEDKIQSRIHDDDWDASPYSVALEIKRLLSSVKDSTTNIDSGTGLLWPFGAPAPIEGHSSADLWVMIGGKEFYVEIRKSNNQLLKEGVTFEQLGLPPEPRNTGPGMQQP